jgi:hypothetical protein
LRANPNASPKPSETNLIDPPAAAPIPHRGVRINVFLVNEFKASLLKDLSRLLDPIPKPGNPSLDPAGIATTSIFVYERMEAAIVLFSAMAPKPHLRHQGLVLGLQKRATLRGENLSRKFNCILDSLRLDLIPGILGGRMIGSHWPFLCAKEGDG